MNYPVATWANLILIVVAMAITVVAIVAGMRLKRKRMNAEHRVAERRDAADLPDEPPPPAPTAEPEVSGEKRAEADEKARPAVNAADPAGNAPKPDAPQREPAEPGLNDTPQPSARAAPPPTQPAADEAAPESRETPSDDAPQRDAAERAAPPADVSSAEPAKPASPSQAPTGGDLTQLKGLGPKVAALLAERGYTSVAQIAALTPDEAAALDADLGAFKGRMARDRWVEQATLLTAGDRAGYEAQFGKLG